MKIYELSFIDTDVKEVFKAFEFALDEKEKGYSIKRIVSDVFDKYHTPIFTSDNLNRVRDCARVMCEDVDDLNTILTLCNYAEIASAAIDWNCGE